MEEIQASWAWGGAGAVVMGICLKWLMPLLQKTAEAATSRQDLDTTAYTLNKELLERMNSLSKELAEAHSRIASLASKLELAEATVRRLTERLAELEGKG